MISPCVFFRFYNCRLFFSHSSPAYNLRKNAISWRCKLYWIEILYLQFAKARSDGATLPRIRSASGKQEWSDKKVEWQRSHLLFLSNCNFIDTLWTRSHMGKVLYRAANNGWSTDNVRLKKGFVWLNLQMAGQFVRSFTLIRKKNRVSSFKYFKVQYHWRLWKRRGKDNYKIKNLKINDSK